MKTRTLLAHSYRTIEMTAGLLLLCLSFILHSLSEPEDQHLELVDKNSLQLGLMFSPDVRHHSYKPELFLLRLRPDPQTKPTDFRSDLVRFTI